MKPSSRSRRRPATSQLRVESLEGRLVLSASIGFGNGVVQITGTEGNDAAVVEQQGRRLLVTVSTPEGEITRNLPARLVRLIRFDALAGDDNFVNNTTKPSLAFGGPGNDSLQGW